MYSFVILGQIPGTNITISFAMWVQLALILVGAIAWYKHTRKQKNTAEQPNVVTYNGTTLLADEVAL